MSAGESFFQHSGQVVNLPLEGGNIGDPEHADRTMGASVDGTGTSEDGQGGAVYLDELLDDDSFRVRPEGDLSLLATDLARLGQLFPIDVREMGAGRYQVICGHRRVAALRFLQRERVLARIHRGLSDEDALLMALSDAIDASSARPEQVYLFQERLRKEGRLTATARDMLEKALSPGEQLAPEHVEEEIDADKLASEVTLRLGEINQDLSLLADVFGSLPEDRRKELLKQLRYSSELVLFLENK